MSEKFGISGLTSNARFVLVSILSLILIVCDSHFNLFKDVRYYIESVMSPLFYLADTPSSVAYKVGERFVSYNDLLNENKFLKQQISEMRTELLRFDSLVEENEQLKKLNNSDGNTYMRIGAEVLRVDTNPFSLNVIINRGEKDGVYEGQPVINEQGVVGQVVSVARTTSRVLLLSDANHSIPVIDTRNGVRAIASGTGVINELAINNIPRNVDIKEGDLLVTSGLGGKFPSGYPVAKVVKYEGREGAQFAEIKAVTFASLDRLRYMLLIWNNVIDEDLLKEEKDNNSEVLENVVKNVLELQSELNKTATGGVGSYDPNRKQRFNNTPNEKEGAQ